MSDDVKLSRPPADPHYSRLVGELDGLLDGALRTSAHAVNAVMTTTYFEIGRRIVEFEQRGARRAGYGEELLGRLARDLSERHGRGFSLRNLRNFRLFYLEWGIRQTVSAESGHGGEVSSFPLPWSHYVRLLTVKNRAARKFYEMEALRGGWSVRQLDRQVGSMFYERTALSRDKAGMLTKGAEPRKGDRMSASEEVRDPLVLEFLNLKDEYSESDLEEALLNHLEHFLLELGGDFAFVGRQRRLRIGDEWYRVDLLFFHRALRGLVVIDLKVGKLTHADAGQMHTYLNYARSHWTREGENPPVGLILCSERNDALARYALEGLPNQVVAREYRMALPQETRLAEEIGRTRERLEARRQIIGDCDVKRSGRSADPPRQAQ